VAVLVVQDGKVARILVAAAVAVAIKWTQILMLMQELFLLL
jgi:hypothetical protein